MELTYSLNEINKVAAEFWVKAEGGKVFAFHGQMGAGIIISSIVTLIEAAEKPLIELVKCLQSYVDNFRTTIKVPDGKGGYIEISHGRSMKPEQLKDLITAIQPKSE